MTWAGSISTLEGILTTAGGTAYTIQSGEPAVPPRQMIAWWYDGTGDYGLIAETLTDHPFGELVTIRAYWPVSNRSAGPSRTLESSVQALARGIVAGLEADRSLGENCAALIVNDASTGWLSVDNAWWRTLTIPIVIGFTDVEPISR